MPWLAVATSQVPQNSGGTKESVFTVDHWHSHTARLSPT